MTDMNGSFWFKRGYVGNVSVIVYSPTYRNHDNILCAIDKIHHRRTR